MNNISKEILKAKNAVEKAKWNPQLIKSTYKIKSRSAL